MPASPVCAHDRPHIKKLIETYPQQLEAICTPYTANTKVVEDESGLWASMKKHNVGWFGIKPFAGNSLFKGDSRPDNPHAKEDNTRAAGNPLHPLQPGDHGAIPGLITAQQVDTWPWPSRNDADWTWTSGPRCSGLWTAPGRICLFTISG